MVVRAVVVVRWLKQRRRARWVEAVAPIVAKAPVSVASVNAVGAIAAKKSAAAERENMLRDARRNGSNG